MRDLKRSYFLLTIVFILFAFVLLVLFVAYFVIITYVVPENELNLNSDFVFSNEKSENFGEVEYECTGSCYCATDFRRGISKSVRVGTSYLVAGISSVIAMKQASKFFKDECVEQYSDLCDSLDNIRSEVDTCSVVHEQDVLTRNSEHGDLCRCESCVTNGHNLFQGSYYGQGSVISEEEKKNVLDGDVSVDSLIRKIGNYKNVIVMTGAGISVNAGIPDFRSPKTGIFDNLQGYEFDDPTDLFNVEYYEKNPIPFLELNKALFPKDVEYQPTKAHYFIKMLYNRGILLRVYTQNVDGLEVKAGVPEEKVIEAHGTFRTASCMDCGGKYSMEKFKGKMYAGDIPIRCEKCKGLIKPDVVFYGESLPHRFFASQVDDFEKCDLLIVIGTSLLVSPFCHLVDLVKPTVPRLLFNGEEVGPWEGLAEFPRGNYRDVSMIGDCDEVATEFTEKCGWGLEDE